MPQTPHTGLEDGLQGALQNCFTNSEIKFYYFYSNQALRNKKCSKQKAFLSKIRKYKFFYSLRYLAHIVPNFQLLVFNELKDGNSNQEFENSFLNYFQKYYLSNDRYIKWKYFNRQLHHINNSCEAENNHLNSLYLSKLSGMKLLYML